MSYFKNPHIKIDLLLLLLLPRGLSKSLKLLYYIMNLKHNILCITRQGQQIGLILDIVNYLVLLSPNLTILGLNISLEYNVTLLVPSSSQIGPFKMVIFNPRKVTYFDS